MGMLDTVRCEHHSVTPLDIEWQTKSGARLLDRYTIDGNGLLWRERWDAEYIDGYRPRTRERFTGTMTFGTDIHQQWWEYRAELVDGHLVSIARLAPADKAFDELYV
jgi:hypothetical protein